MPENKKPIAKKSPANARAKQATSISQKDPKVLAKLFITVYNGAVAECLNW